MSANFVADSEAVEALGTPGAVADGAEAGNLRKEARNIALRFLVRREYSRLEISRKLADRQCTADVISAVLDELEAEGYLSDSRFAELLVRSRLNAAYGPVKILHELREKGVADGMAEEVLHGFQPDWPTLVRQLVLKRFGAVPAGELKERAKRSRYLYTRGFYADDIRAALGYSTTDLPL